MKYLLNFLFLLLFSFSLQDCFSQNDPQTNLEKIIPVSPTAASMAKYGNIPVNYFTGSPSISIPLFNIQTGSLQNSVALSYQFNGLKVEEIPPWVGLGWNLQAGGAVSRSVRGIPDEGTNGYMNGSTPMTVKFMIDNMGNPTYSTTIKNYLTQAGQGNYDLEPDIFYFNFPGGSGKFYYNQEHQKFYTLPVQNITLTYSSNGFLIITPDGNRYHFTEKEYTKTNSPQCSGSPGQASGDPIVTSWYLSKIENKTQTDNITFEYNSVTYSFDHISTNSKYLLISTQGTTDGLEPSFNNQLCFQNTQINGLRLSYIRFRNGYLRFTAATSDRGDLPGDKSLEKIELFNSANDLLKKFSFSYGYFGSGTHLEKRLKLLQVTEEGKNGLQLNPYGFDYEEDGIFPSRFSYAQDHWGYYNGASTNQHLIPSVFYVSSNGGNYLPGDDRKPNFSFAKLGALKAITYPTKGATHFEFENNEVSDSVIQPEYAWHTVSIEGDHNGGAQTQYSTAFSVNEPSGFYNNNNPNGGAYVDLSFTAIGCTFPNGASNCAILRVEDQNGNTVIGPMIADRQGIYLPNGNYYLKASFNQTPPGFEDFYFSIKWRKPVLNNSNLIGGIRIKKITDIDSVDVTKKIVRRFTYTSDENGLSSGKACGYPNSYVNTFNHEYYSSRYVGTGCVVYSLFREFKKFTSVSNYPLTAHQGGYVGYQQVNVLHGENSENGKTVYRYQYFPDLVGEFPPVATSREWNRGLLLSERHYKNVSGSYTLLNLDSTFYSNLSEVDAGILSIAYGLKTAFDLGVTLGSGECWNPIYFLQRQNEAAIPDVTEYETITNNSPVKENRNIKYEGSGTLEVIQQYTYNGKNYLPSQLKTINSKGDTIITRYKYNVDYTVINNNPSWLYQLSGRNITQVPVEKLILKKSPGGPEYVIGGTISVFRNDNPLNDKVYVLETSVPIALASFTQSFVDGNGNFVKDNRYKEAISINQYDVFNNILSQQKANDIRQSYLWGYNKSYPVAEATNASANEIFFDSFEEGTGWSGTTAPQYGDHAISAFDNTKWRAGGYSARIDKPTSGEWYCHSNQTLNISLTAPAKFMVSGWVYSTGPSIDIYLFMKRASESYYFSYVDFLTTSTTNQWVYVEKEFTVPADVTRLNLRLDNNGGGSVWFDDIRLYPSVSQMTTYTYKPLIGMTSATDANNRTTFYEYDVIGRLSLVRDQNGKILKKFCYNLAGYQEQCGNLFMSAAINDYYYSQNCSPGETALPYYVSVPVGAFTSTLSQTDANQQAAQYAQSQANLYGTCQAPNVSLYYNNYYTGADYYMELYNPATGLSYWFDAYAYSNGLLGDVPEGTYDIWIGSSDYYNYHSYSVGCGYYNGGYNSVSFYGVYLGPGCNNFYMY